MINLRCKIRHLQHGLFGVLIAFALWGTTPALALTADELHGKIVETFQLYGGLYGDDSPYRYDTIDVVPEGESFHVVIEGLTLVLDPTSDAKLDIGRVGMMLHPAGLLAGDESYRITDLEISDSIPATENGEEVFRLRHESASLEALWAFAYMTPLSMDLLVETITAVDPEGAVLTSIDSLSGDVRTNHKQGDVYDMTFNGKLSKFSAQDGKSAGSFDGATVLSQVDDYDLAAALASTQSLMQAIGSENPTPEQVAAIQNHFLSSELWAGASDTQVEVLGLRIDDAASGSTFALEQMGFAFAMTKQDNADLTTFGFGFGHRGLEASGDPQISTALGEATLPRNSTFQIDLENLPASELFRLAFEMAQASAETGQGGETDSPAAMMFDPRMQQIMELVSQAGTALAIRDSELATNSGRFSMDGRFKVSPEAAFGVIGVLDASLVGLDELTRLTQEAMGSQDPTEREQATDMIGVLGILQAYAVRETDDQGAPLDRFVVEVRPDGAVTVNGQPVMPGAPQ